MEPTHEQLMACLWVVIFICTYLLTVIEKFIKKRKGYYGRYKDSKRS